MNTTTLTAGTDHQTGHKTPPLHIVLMGRLSSLTFGKGITDSEQKTAATARDADLLIFTAGALAEGFVPPKDRDAVVGTLQAAGDKMVLADFPQSQAAMDVISGYVGTILSQPVGGNGASPHAGLDPEVDAALAAETLAENEGGVHTQQ